MWFIRLQPGRHRFKKHLNYVPLDYKMEEAYTGKKLQGQLVPYVVCKELFRDGKKSAC